MKKLKTIVSRLGNILSCSDGGPHITSHPIVVDVREEYANAFRTESYIDFWTRVISLTQLPVEPTTATHLLDPTQPTVQRILTSAHLGPNSNSLLSDYFSHTANASLLCARLLKEIDNLRLTLPPLELTFKPLSTRLSTERVQIIQNGCSKLLRQLESNRDKARAKLKRVRYFQHSSAGFLVAITTSLTVLVVTHGVALFVAAPGLLVGAIKLAKSRKLAKEVARLNVAAKGTYTLNRDFDTIGRLATRLNHELEHMRVMTGFWLERRRAVGEVLRQLKQSRVEFRKQLDELEEHLYLCFMTINRARNLVVKEILDLGQPIKIPYV